jgi:hypothetical protein
MHETGERILRLQDWADFFEELGLFPLHADEILIVLIVEAAQVEQAVEDVGQDFMVQGEAGGAALFFGHGWANQDFPVLEGDDIRRGGVAHEFGMHLSDGGRGQERDLDGVEVLGQSAGEQGGGDFTLPAKPKQGKPVRFLPVVDRDPEFPGVCGLWGIRSGHGACSSAFR